MEDQMQSKSSVEEIRKRFDANVERFSNLETGQAATVDSPLAMALITEVAAAVTPKAASVLDVGKLYADSAVGEGLPLAFTDCSGEVGTHATRQRHQRLPEAKGGERDVGRWASGDYLKIG